MFFLRMAAQLAFLRSLPVVRCCCPGADYVVVVSKRRRAILSGARWSRNSSPNIRRKWLFYDTNISESLRHCARRSPLRVFRCDERGSRPTDGRRRPSTDPQTRRRSLCRRFWGILTGYDAANALAIAREREPLVIKRVASGTELAMDRVTEGVWYCELEQNRMVRKIAVARRRRSMGRMIQRRHSQKR